MSTVARLKVVGAHSINAASGGEQNTKVCYNPSALIAMTVKRAER